MNDLILRKIDHANVLITLVLSMVSIPLFRLKISTALIAGALLMTVNLYVLRRLFKRLLSHEQRGFWGIFMMLLFKFGLLFGLASLCIREFKMDPMAFGLGIAAIILTSVVVATQKQILPANY